jgi:hypothetical protein
MLNPRKSAGTEGLSASISKGYFVNLKKSLNLPEVIIIYPIYGLPVNIWRSDKSVDNIPNNANHRAFFRKFDRL